MDLSIRRADADDIPVISALAHTIWHQHYTDIIGEAQVAYMLHVRYTPEALYRQLEDTPQQFWLAWHEGTMIGYLSVEPRADGVLFLHKFYLDNAVQGNGFGQAIFDKLLWEYSGITAVHLYVNRRNYKTVNFYFKLGFRIDHCVDMPIGEGFMLDDFYMIKNV